MNKVWAIFLRIFLSLIAIPLYVFYLYAKAWGCDGGQCDIKFYETEYILHFLVALTLVVFLVTQKFFRGIGRAFSIFY